MLELLDVALKRRPGRLARLVLQHFNEDQGLFECLVHSAVRLRGRLAPLSPERVITASTPGHIKRGWCKFGNVMAIRNAIVFCFVQLLLLAGPPAITILFADTHEVRVQFCWAVGKFDHTIYFAEAEAHEDRQASFAELIEISGIDHHPIECRMLDSRSYRLLRADLIKKWSASEFELVNTTFLSDLDY